MLRSIREEPGVTAALKAAGHVYPRLWDAYESMCWMLARREMAGATVTRNNNVYYLYKQGAGGFGVPALLVAYTVSEDVICLHAIKVG